MSAIANDVMPNIYQRLAAVMKAISYVQKESKRVNNQYTFVSHDAVTAKVRVHFVEHGIVTITRVVAHRQDGNRTEVDVEVDFVNVDNPEDKVIVPCFGYGIDPQDKGPGKAISYAVKYAYLKVLALETGDDPERDSIDHKPTEKIEEKPTKITEEQLNDLQSLIDEVEADYAGFLKFLKIERLSDLAADKYARAVKALESKRKQA